MESRGFIVYKASKQSLTAAGRKILGFNTARGCSFTFPTTDRFDGCASKVISSRSGCQSCVAVGNKIDLRISAAELRNISCLNGDYTLFASGDLINVLRDWTGSVFTTSKAICSCGSGSKPGLRCLRNCGAASRGCKYDFRYFRPSGVILISRQRHSSQNTDNRHNDHQFNQGKTFLHLSFHVFLLESVQALSLLSL